jgi:hypothetical protein
MRVELGGLLGDLDLPALGVEPGRLEDGTRDRFGGLGDGLATALGDLPEISGRCGVEVLDGVRRCADGGVENGLRRSRDRYDCGPDWDAEDQGEECPERREDFVRDAGRREDGEDEGEGRGGSGRFGAEEPEYAGHDAGHFPTSNP